MQKFGKVLVSCLTFLLPLLGAGVFPRVHAEDLPQPQFVRRSVGLTFIEDLDIEYVVTGGEVKHITMSGEIPSQNFQISDGTYRILSGGITLTQNGSTIRNNSTITIYPQSVSGQSGTSAGHTDAAQITLESSEVQTSDQVVSIKYNYVLVQRLFIGFDRPAVGFIDIAYSVKSGRTLSTYRMPFSDTSVYLPSWSSGTASIRDYGSAVCQVDFIEVNTNKSSINVSPFITFDETTWANHTVAYEAPVSDNDSHELLTSVLEALDGSKGQQSSVDNANQNVNDSVSGLSNQGNQMHTVENNIMNSMNTALQSQDLQTDVVSEIRGNNNLNASLSWVSNQVTRIISGFNDITPMWEFMFIMPLIIGIGLVIIGRLR